MLISASFDIHFDFFVFVTFLIGFIFGAIFLVLFYLLFSLISLNKSKKNIEHFDNEEKEKEINLIIKTKQADFLNLRENGTSTATALRTSCLELINQIAHEFYPNSKHPVAELTIDELILLDKYIILKIEGILNKKGLKILRKLRISTILKIADANTKIQNNKAIKMSKKLHIPKIAKVVNLVLNAINPFYWFKKLVLSPSLNFLIKKILLLTISTIGQETYQVYSKKLFIDDEEEAKEIEQELEKEKLEEQNFLETISKNEIRS